MKTSILLFIDHLGSHTVGPVAYQLALPAYSHVYPVFHVSQLKRVMCAYTPCEQFPEFMTGAGPIN